MTKEQFNELWNIYIPEIDESKSLIRNGVSERLANALEEAYNNNKCLAVGFES